MNSSTPCDKNERLKAADTIRAEIEQFGSSTHSLRWYEEYKELEEANERLLALSTERRTICEKCGNPTDCRAACTLHGKDCIFAPSSATLPPSIDPFNEHWWVIQFKDGSVWDEIFDDERIALRHLTQKMTLNDGAKVVAVRLVAVSDGGTDKKPGYMGDVNGPGCYPDVP